MGPCDMTKCHHSIKDNEHKMFKYNYWNYWILYRMDIIWTIYWNSKNSFKIIIMKKVDFGNMILSYYLSIPWMFWKYFKMCIQRFKSWLSGWSTLPLSMATHPYYAHKSVLSLILLYSMQFTRIPQGIVQEFEWLCRNFLGGTMTLGRHYASWIAIVS